MIVKIDIDGEQHEIEQGSLTMGEKWLLARDFGVEFTEDGFGFGGVVGLLVVALMRDGVPEGQAKSRVLALRDEQVTVEQVGDDTPRPTTAVKDGKAKRRAPSGKSGTSASTG